MEILTLLPSDGVPCRLTHWDHNQLQRDKYAEGLITVYRDCRAWRLNWGYIEGTQLHVDLQQIVTAKLTAEDTLEKALTRLMEELLTDLIEMGDLVSTEWRTLHDHLHTKNYLVYIREAADLYTRLRVEPEGPWESPSFNMRPAPLNTSLHNAEKIAKYPASSLLVLDEEEAPPRTVALESDPSKVFYFQPLVADTKDPGTGELSNPARKKMQDWVDKTMKARASGKQTGGPNVLGVVTDGDLIAGVLLAQAPF